MKSKLFSALTMGAVLIAQPVLVPAAEQGFVRIFNGKDLAGWEGNPKL